MDRENVLVTGANGYIGAHLVKKLLDNRKFVWAIVRSKQSDISAIESLDNCRIIVCPMDKIASLDSLIECEDIKTCYHLAWSSGKKIRQENFLSQERLIEYSISLMDVMNKKKCKKFIATGSILETNTLLPLARHPNMIYAVTKDCTNKLLKIRSDELKMQYTWCRLCGVYGDNDNTGNLISYTISSLKKGISPEYSLGVQPYSFIHVDDCAEALIRIGENLVCNKSLMTLSGPECMTIKEYMTIIKSSIASETSLKFGVRADDGVRYTKDMFDNRDLIKCFGMVYKHMFKDEIIKSLS